MNKKALSVLTLVALSLNAAFGAYSIGDQVAGFTLKNVDGNMVSLSDYSKEKGVAVVFTCNHCPYSIAYEQRLIDLHNTYTAKGYPVLFINPNDPEVQPGDSYEAMQKLATEKSYPFPYLFDDGQKVYPQFGATNTPHVFLLNNKTAKFDAGIQRHHDDNYKDASAVTKTYLSDAIDALIAGKKPSLSETKAIGCSIKVKSAPKTDACRVAPKFISLPALIYCRLIKNSLSATKTGSRLA